jgi:predicted XRE-type DNA-binding protein
MGKANKNIWEAIYNHSSEANDQQKCPDYLLLITARLQSHPGPIAERAKHFGLSASLVSDLQNRRVDKFTLPELIAIARKIGITAKL